MSKFFEDVGDLITEPFRQAYGFVTGDPKHNSPGDLWNRSFGPGNALQNVVSDLPTTQAFKKIGLGDQSKLFESPTWDDLGTPGEAFAKHVDTANQALPEAFQPYAQPIETAVLSAFNPFAGAAFQTAYQGGKQQEAQKGFDWGELGKNAAINFGTAAVATGADKLLKNAETARAAKANYGDVASLSSSPTLASALDPFEQVGTSAATPGFASTASSVPSTTSALSRAGVSSSLTGFSPSTSESLVPEASALQSSGLADAAYDASINTGKKLAGPAITETLAPEGSQPLTGALDSFAAEDLSGTGASRWGDVLNAFIGPEINTPNPNGERIGVDAFNQAVNRLAANSFLQQEKARDVALPAGQFQATQNTPYAKRLDEINFGTTQSYIDLLEQVQNANKYYGILDANEGLTVDELNTFIKDPSTGALGRFFVPEEDRGYFTNIRPVGPQNMSLIN